MTKIDLIEFEIRGMTCDSCAVHVEKALRTVPGVEEVIVPGWKFAKAEVKAQESVAIISLVGAVRKAGYEAVVKERQSSRQKRGPVKAAGRNDFDLMVIGGGSAGFAAAIKGAELGYEIALVEAGTIGGTCVNIGCVPSKTLIRSLDQYHQAGHSPFRGVQTKAVGLDWVEVITQKNELIADLRQNKYVDVLAAYPNITYIPGRARLTGGNCVEIDGKTYAPGKIIIATGASPWAPPILGLVEAGYLTSTTAMELTELPRSMIVLGANAVGLELAQVFARAGTLVTVLELMPRIAPFEDEVISAALQGYLEEEGLRIVPNLKTIQVKKKDGRYRLSGELNGKEMTFDADQLMVATGRRSNTTGMGLNQSGVELGQRGETLVDETLLTSNPNVYAAGDVIGKDMFVYVAAYAGGLAAENALGGVGRVYNTAHIPRVTFTDPQIASAGLTEAQARQQGYDVKVGSLSMSFIPRALAARDTRGLIKLVVDASNNQLLGAHILAPEAGEIIQTTVLALRFGLTVNDLRETFFPYLTNAEGIKLAAQSLEKDVSLLSCCAG